jgi:hypothetical protein
MEKRSYFLTLAAVIASLVAASVAATAHAGTGAKRPTVTPAAQTPGTVQVRFAVDRFVAHGRNVFAKGEVIATYASQTDTYVTRSPFSTKVVGFKAHPRAARHVSRANRICNVLELNLAPLRLNLLGLIVELDRVHLTVKADSEGGLLGSLLCSLAGGGVSAQTAATQLTQAAQTSGLASGAGFQVPIAPASASTPQTQALPPVPGGVCTVLDLPIGPLDLNLLGLLVHLDRTELRVTADPNGGILGSLLCSLAGGPNAAATATPVVPAR